MKPTRPAYKPWSEAEKATLTTLYSTYGPDYVAKVIDRPVQGVRQMAMRLKQTYETPKEQRIAHSRLASAARWANREEKKPASRPSCFTPEIEALLRRLWPVSKMAEVIEATGLSKSTLNVYGTRLQLGRIGHSRVKPVKVKPVKEPRMKAVKPPKEPVFRTTDFRTRKPRTIKPEPEKRGYHYPMNSPQYKEWEASLYQGKQAVSFIDDMNRPTTIYRKAA